MRLRLMQLQLCTLCGQNIADSDDMKVMGVLFGAAPYAVCPKCFNEVPKSQWTPAYKRGWKKRVREILKRTGVN